MGESHGRQALDHGTIVYAFPNNAPLMLQWHVTITCTLTTYTQNIPLTRCDFVSNFVSIAYNKRRQTAGLTSQLARTFTHRGTICHVCKNYVFVRPVTYTFRSGRLGTEGLSTRLDCSCTALSPVRFINYYNYSLSGNVVSWHKGATM